MKYLQIIILIIALILIFFIASKLLNKEPMENEINELTIETLIEGEGGPSKIGDTLSVHYRGTLTTGEQFDSSYDRGTPFELTLGQGMVIQGWEQGLIGMKKGEKRKLYIPSNLAYGERGAGDIIKPNADLIFEVELLKINGGED